MSIKKVKLTDLVLDFDLYPRNDVSSESVTRLSDALASGATLPAIIVDKRTNRIADGFHRYRAHQRMNLETINAEYRDFPTDADFYEFAVASNTEHGRPLDSYDMRRIIVRMAELGFERLKIEDVLRIPPVKFEQLSRNSATNTNGDSIPLKRGLGHLRDVILSTQQRKAVESYGGMSATFYVNQLVSLLDNNLFKPTENSVEGLDHLVELWSEKRANYVESIAVAA